MLSHRFAQRATNLFSVGLILCFLFSLSAYGQSADELALHSLAEKFFAAYQKPDLDGLMQLWSEKSPDFATSRQSFQQSFAANKIELKSLTMGKVTIEGEKASLRVVVDLNAVEVKTGKPATGFGKINSTLHFIKEGSVWKVWRYVSSEEELAAALVEAKTDEERRLLLEKGKESITVALVQALLEQTRRLMAQNRNILALAIYRLIKEIANQLGDQKSQVTAFRGMGNIHVGQGNYPQALEDFQKSLTSLRKSVIS